MKTTLLTIATALFLTVTTGTTLFAATNTNDAATSTVLTQINNINKIEVHGNVELYITSGVSDKVKVYDSYYNQNALVQEQNGVLRISSFKAEKLVVWVTVTDLRKLSAYDNAAVKSFGKFSALDLDLDLNNNATANLDLDCIDAKIALNDNSKADITGNAAQSNLVINHAATINTSNFTAGQSTQTRIAARKITFDELAAN